MKMKKKGYAMGGMKKGYAMGGMKKKMKAGGGVKKFNEGAKVERPTGMMTQKQIDDPKRAVAAGNRMSKMRAQEGVPGKKPMRPKTRSTTAPMTSMTPPSRPNPMPMNKKGGSIKKMKAGGMPKKKGFAPGGKVAKKGKAKGGKMGGKSKVRGAGIAQRGVRPAQMR